MQQNRDPRKIFFDKFTDRTVHKIDEEKIYAHRGGKGAKAEIGKDGILDITLSKSHFSIICFDCAENCNCVHLNGCSCDHDCLCSNFMGSSNSEQSDLIIDIKLI